MIIVPFARTIVGMRPAAAAVKAQDELATLGLDCGLAGRRKPKLSGRKEKTGLALKAAIFQGTTFTQNLRHFQTSRLRSRPSSEEKIFDGAKSPNNNSYPPSLPAVSLLALSLTH
jgi:hypothetical protein